MGYNQTGEVSVVDKHVGRAPRGMQGQFLEAPAPASVNGSAKYTQILTQGLPSAPPMIVNAGTYRSSIDVFSLGVNVHY